MRAVFRALLPTCAILLLSTCDEELDQPLYDHSYFVQYTVSNHTSSDLTIRYGSYFFYCYKPPVSVPAGSTTEFAYYEEFLGPPPDASRCFTCISVYRNRDHTLVFQLAPVRNRQFKRIEHRKYHEEYRLELTDATLVADGMESLCAEVFGAVIDSITTAPVDFYHVGVSEDVPQSYYIMQTNTGPSSDYSMLWYGDVPDGTMWFAKRGYRCRSVRIPATCDSLGGGLYRLDVELAPYTAPEDSMRYCSP